MFAGKMNYPKWKFQQLLTSRLWDLCKSAQIRKLQENINTTGLSKKDISWDCSKEIQHDFHAV